MAAANAPLKLYQTPTNQQFNQQVLSAAKAQYEPALNEVGQDTQAEDATNGARNQYLNSVYNGYKQQVEGDDQATKGMVNGLQNQETGLNESNADLGAAIGSSYGNANSLAALGLGQGATPQQLADYSSAANTSSQSNQEDLNGIAANLLAAGPRQLTNIAGERAQSLIGQNETHESNLQGLRTAKTGIIDDIPGVLEQERQSLLNQLQTAQNSHSQQQLAHEQLLVQQGQLANQTHTTDVNAANSTATTQANILHEENADKVAEQDAITAEKNATTGAARQTAQAQETYYNQQLALDRINQQALNERDKNQQGALKFISSWLAPSKGETVSVKTGGGTNLKTGAANPTVETSQLSGSYKRNPASLIQALRSQYNMSRDQALTLVANDAVPLSGGPNAQTLGQWASEQLNPRGNLINNIQTGGFNTPSVLTPNAPKRLKTP